MASGAGQQVLACLVSYWEVLYEVGGNLAFYFFVFLSFSIFLCCYSLFFFSSLFFVQDEITAICRKM